MSKPWDRLRVPPPEVKPTKYPITPGQFTLPGGALMGLVKVYQGSSDVAFLIDGRHIALTHRSWRCAAEFILEVLDENERPAEESP